MAARPKTTSPMTRSEIMSCIRSKDTTPERTVRSALHRLGFRYKLHVKGLPGCPDIAFPSKKKVLFIHGCFWHGHECKVGTRTPKTNTDYWVNKIERNRCRDSLSVTQLIEAGWAVMVIWECELAHREEVLTRIVDFLSEGSQTI